MFINKLNQLYKPERALYFLEADGNDAAAFYRGVTDGRISGRTGAFGTYDYPGLFYIRGRSAPVIGVEYRPGDDRIDYPGDLEHIVLDEAFFYSIEIDSEPAPGIEDIAGLFRDIAADDDAHR